jgi:CubicO group peptidase (beta-lactamase class C family)
MKNMKLYLSLVFTLIISNIALCYGQEDVQQIKTLSGNEISTVEMDKFLKNQMDSLNVKGISIAIINDAKVVYHRSIGIANAYSLDTVNDQTIFEAASVSKPIFAYFVMKMVEKGLLNLDTPLYQYLSYRDIEHDDRYKLITARMVLDHTSGFPNWRSNNFFNQEDGKLYINFTPGTKFSYSGEGYVYLAKVIAHLTKRDLSNLDSVFQQEVSKPLHLKHAHFGMNVYVAKHLASGHDGNKITYSHSWDRTLFNPACGLYTEAMSFANFLIAIMEDKGLKKESINEMLKKQVQVPDEDNTSKIGGVTEWSLGFARKPSIYGMNISHRGNNWGYSSFFLINKEKKFGYVFFTNSNSCHNPQCTELWQKLEPFLTNGK